MTLVSNSSVLIALASIGKLELLKTKFKELHVPTAVWREIVEEGRGRPGATELEASKWVVRREVSNRTLVEALKARLDDGEAEALALAKQLDADRILLDERGARKQAKSMGLVPLGTLGILALAKRNGLVSSVGELAARLEESGFRIHSRLLRRVLDSVGE